MKRLELLEHIRVNCEKTQTARTYSPNLWKDLNDSSIFAQTLPCLPSLLRSRIIHRNSQLRELEEDYNGWRPKPKVNEPRCWNLFFFAVVFENPFIVEIKQILIFQLFPHKKNASSIGYVYSLMFVDADCSVSSASKYDQSTRHFTLDVVFLVLLVACSSKN